MARPFVRAITYCVMAERECRIAHQQNHPLPSNLSISASMRVISSSIVTMSLC